MGLETNSLLGKFSDQEIEQLIWELENNGFLKRYSAKEIVVREVSAELGMVNPYISQDVTKYIYGIADWATKNKEEKKCRDGKTREYFRKTVPKEIEDEYRAVLSGILAVIKPYYGKRNDFRPKR